MWKCIHCGTQRQEEQMLCPQCGWREVTSSHPPVPGPTEEQKRRATLPTSPMHMLYPQQPPSSINNTGTVPSFLPPGSGGTGAYYWGRPGPSQTHLIPPGRSGGYPFAFIPPSDEGQPGSLINEQPSNTLSRVLTTMIFVLVVLLISSGIGLIYYTSINHPTTQTAQRSHTNQQANLTQAPRSIKQTPEGKANNSLQSLYNTATSSEPSIYSALAFQTDNQWNIYPTTDGGGCSFTGGSLHASIFSTRYYVPCIAQNTSLSNFTLQIDMVIIKGDAGGIIFRSDIQSKNFYSFRIQEDGSYEFMLTRNTVHTAIINNTSNAITRGIGQKNTITLIARGNSFYFFINKIYVGSASDANYATGAIGVLAIDLQNNTDVAFTHLRIWNPRT